MNENLRKLAFKACWNWRKYAWIFNIYIQYLLKVFLLSTLKTNTLWAPSFEGVCISIFFNISRVVQSSILSTSVNQHHKTKPCDSSSHWVFLSPQISAATNLCFKNKNPFIVMNPQMKISHRYTKVVTETNTCSVSNSVHLNDLLHRQSTIYFSRFAYSGHLTQMW